MSRITHTAKVFGNFFSPRNFTDGIFVRAFPSQQRARTERTAMLTGLVARNNRGRGWKVERERFDLRRRWPMTGLTGSDRRHQHPARYPSVDRQIRRPEGRRPVSGRPQCNHLWRRNGCNRPLSITTHHSDALHPSAEPASPPDPGKSSLRPDYPSRLLIGIETLSRRGWPVLTRSACDRLHSEPIRPPRTLQLQLCVVELRQVGRINHRDWIDVRRAIGRAKLLAGLFARPRRLLPRRILILNWDCDLSKIKSQTYANVFVAFFFFFCIEQISWIFLTHSVYKKFLTIR